jgi:hypothetical protein
MGVMVVRQNDYTASQPEELKEERFHHEYPEERHQKTLFTIVAGYLNYTGLRSLETSESGSQFNNGANRVEDSNDLSR